MRRFTFLAWPAGRLERAAAAGLAVAAALVLATAVPAEAAAGARTAAPGSTWGTASEVPGLAALNQGGSAAISSLSCGSAGNCSAGGAYTDGAGHDQAFVVSQAHGRWGTATQVPGLAALNTRDAGIGIYAMSCASAGNCSAGGFYTGPSNRRRAFVVSQTNGRWGQATPVTGAGVNAGPLVQLGALSCASAGNCAAGGFYAENSGQEQSPEQAFVVSQADGSWGTAQQVPGLAALNAGGQARVNAISCGAAGNCTAGGTYTDGSGHDQAFVVTETRGSWGTAQQVPGTAALNAGGHAELDALSCASAGNCSAGGAYLDGFGQLQTFVVTQEKGSWAAAEQVPGSAALNAGGAAAIGFGSLSCAPAGTCAAGGIYTDRSGQLQVFVASQKAGSWGTAEQVPGAAALNQGGNAFIGSLSCGPAGTCAAGGNYADRAGQGQAFVVSQAHGSWGTAEQVPGTAALNAGGNASTNAVSCPPGGRCSAGGFYTDRSGHQQAFVADQS
jgi:hypothetical protein